jgi:hypothetical protein
MASSGNFPKCDSCEHGFIGKDNDYKGFKNEQTKETLCLNCYEGRVIEQTESADLKARAREAALDREIKFRRRVSYDRVYAISVRDLMDFITDDRENVMTHITEQNLVNYAQTATKHFRLPDHVWDDEHIEARASAHAANEIIQVLEQKNKIKYRPTPPT